MASIRQLIVNALESRLKTVTAGSTWQLPDGSYQATTTIKTVTGWRNPAAPFTKTEMPAVNIRDTESGFNDAPLAHFEHRLDISLAGLVTGLDAVIKSRALLADMVAVIGSDRTFGGLARWTEITGQRLDAEIAADLTVGCELSISVIYRTRLWRM